MKRILVLRGGAIGDFVLTLPAIKLLRDNFPQTHLEILGYKHIVALVENRFYADAIRSIEYGPLASFFARGTELPADLCDYFNSFDLVLSYLFDPDLIFEGNVRRCGVETFIAASPKITAGSHAARQLARPLEQLGLELRDDAAKLFPTDADRAAAGHHLPAEREPVIAIHPGSGSESKNWPSENWSELIKSATAAAPNTFFVIIGGEADERVIAALREDLSDLPTSFVVNQPLPHVVALLSRCDLFIGHDSGISHIAAAVGTRCTLLFGPSDPAVWAPLNAKVRVIRPPSGQMSDITVAEAFETFTN